jgi:hypothetical protein
MAKRAALPQTAAAVWQTALTGSLNDASGRRAAGGQGLGPAGRSGNDVT